MPLASSEPLLAQFSSCEISDALLKLGVASGGHLPDIAMYSPSESSEKAASTRICGPAYTVQMVKATDPFAPTLNYHFVDTIRKGTVVVINAPPQSKNAVWGGLMTAGAQAHGALGVIISGRCRDLSEHRGANFPVFASGHSTVGQSPFTRASAVEVPVTISVPEFPSTTVNPGDWIVADEDGVVCVPKGLVEQVVAFANKGREADKRCMEDIKAGKSVQETFKLHRGRGAFARAYP